MLILRGIAVNFVGRIWSTLSGFLFVPLYIHILGFEGYTLISLSLMIGGLVALLDGGLTGTLNREFARADLTTEEKLHTFETLENIYLAILMVATLATLGLVYSDWLSSDGFRRVLGAFGVDISCQLMMRFYIGGLFGFSKHVTANSYQISWGVVRNALVLVVLYFSPLVEVFFLWQALASLVFVLLVRAALCQQLSVPRSHYVFAVHKAVIERVKRFTLGMFLIVIVAAVTTQVDKLAISHYLSLETLAYYTLAVSLAMGLNAVAGPIYTVSLPIFTSLYSRNNRSEASLLFFWLNLGVACVVFSIASCLIVCPQQVLWVWTGQALLSERTSDYLPAIAFGNAMLAMAILPYSVAIANGNTKLNNRIGIASVFFTVPGYWIATAYVGGIGAATVFCITQTCITIVFTYFVYVSYLDGPGMLITILGHVVIPLAASLAVASVGSRLLMVHDASQIETLIRLSGTALLTLVFTILSVLPLLAAFPNSVWRRFKQAIEIS